MSLRDLLDRLDGDLTEVAEAIDNATDFDPDARDLLYLSLGRVQGALSITPPTEGTRERG